MKYNVTDYVRIAGIGKYSKRSMRGRVISVIRNQYGFHYYIKLDEKFNFYGTYIPISGYKNIQRLSLIDEVQEEIDRRLSEKRSRWFYEE